MNIKVCVVVPDYKIEKSADEQFSIMQLLRKIQKTPIFYVLPKTLNNYDLDLKDHIYFHDFYFKSIITYSQLLLSSYFWKKFLDYTHVLLYQPDCRIAGDDDELNFWCRLGFSFIGAPHFAEYSYEKNPTQLQDTMNGGFSLRDVQDHYRMCKALESHGFKHRECQAHEDTMWVDLFKQHNFRLPDSITAAHFAHEQGSEALYLMTKNTIPFGFHASEKYKKDYPTEIKSLIF